MLLFEKNNMPFNLKKLSAIATSVQEPVKQIILDKLNNQEFLSELLHSVEQTPAKKETKKKPDEKSFFSSQNNILLQTWHDTISDKVMYTVKEIKKRKILDPTIIKYFKNKKIYSRAKTGNREYFISTNADLSMELTSEELKSLSKDKKALEFRKQLEILNQPPLKNNYEFLQNTMPDFKLTLTDSKGKTELEHFNKQNDKCYYCGRDLYGGLFEKGEIHLEHMVDKANWRNEINDGQKLLIDFISNKNMMENKKALEDAQYITGVIEQNAVNSFQNWVYADAECNMSKGDLPHFSFIDFMQKIHSVNTPLIINKNKLIYQNFSENANNFKNIKIDTTYQVKSYEVYHEYLVNLLENHEEFSTIEQLNELYLPVITSYSNVLEKINELELILKKPEFKAIIEDKNYISRLNSFNETIRGKKAADFKDDKTFQSTYELCSCSICGNKLTNPSPLELSSNLTLFDVTESVDNFQWQLVHADCAKRCGKISVKTIRFLAQKINNYNPERNKITEKLGSNIEQIYKNFKKHLLSLKEEMAKMPEKTAFNLFKFIRRGGR